MSDGAGKSLDADGGESQHAEIGKAKQDRCLPEQREAAGQRGARRGTRVRAAAERAFLQREGEQRHQAGGADRQQRGAPAERAADTVAHDRGGGEAQAAADTVHAVRMPEPARVDVGVEHREVGRMENAVADAHQRGQREQPVDARNERRAQRAAGQKADSTQQDRPRAKTIDGETGRELTRAAGHVEHADQRAERGIAHVELRLEQRKQRRQGELEEVRQAMRRADQPDDADVTAERRAVGGRGSGSHGSVPTISHDCTLLPAAPGTWRRAYSSNA